MTCQKPHGSFVDANRATIGLNCESVLTAAGVDPANATGQEVIDALMDALETIVEQMVCSPPMPPGPQEISDAQGDVAHSDILIWVP